MEATPETRFAPERFQASLRPGSRISAAIAVVVVLPFVAETTAAPSRKPRRERVDRAGIELPEELAGQRRAAARAGDPGELGGRARGQGLDGEAGAHQSASLPVDWLGTGSDPSFEGTSRALTLTGEEPAQLRAYVCPVPPAGAAASCAAERFHAARASARTRRTMGRNTGGNPGDVRKSALWGSGNRGGEHRSNALWGKGGRGFVTTVLVVALAVPLGGRRGKRVRARMKDSLRGRRSSPRS